MRHMEMEEEMVARRQQHAFLEDGILFDAVEGISRRCAASVIAYPSACPEQHVATRRLEG